MVGGLALTFALCLATAGQFLGGPRAGRVRRRAARRRTLGAGARAVRLRRPAVGRATASGTCGATRRAAWSRPRMRREFYGLIPAYVFAMLLVAVSNNLGILWIAVELTTLASVFLVTFHNRDTSLEAAWKFLMLGSLGLGFALLGTVLLFAAGQGHLGEGHVGAQLDAPRGRRRPSCIRSRCGSASSSRSSATARRPAWPRCTRGSPTPTAKRRRRRAC